MSGVVWREERRGTFQGEAPCQVKGTAMMSMHVAGIEAIDRVRRWSYRI